MSALEVTSLAFAYDGALAVRDVSISVQPGEIVALLGANGAGKSTTVRMIAGVLTPQKGDIRFAGEVLTGSPSHVVVRRGITLVPEGRLVFPQMTVMENLQLGAHIKQRNEVAALVEQAFALFPRLAERRSQLAGSMSGGEQQMLAIARGLMAEPKLIILDEPSLGLMPIVTQEVFKLIEAVNKRGISVLLVEQNLHQSLRNKRTGANAFIPDGDGPLSALGRHYLAGLLAHARGAAAFTTPSVNGYKRYRQYTLAPDRAIWGRDNRGVMLRVIGGAGDGATRIENRVGEPSANPYLYMASQIICGLDGVEQKLEPGPSADTPYEMEAPLLPKSLEEALVALRDDACIAAGLGKGFVDYFLRIKRGELARYQTEVTDWEQREYFELY